MCTCRGRYAPLFLTGGHICPTPRSPCQTTIKAFVVDFIKSFSFLVIRFISNYTFWILESSADRKLKVTNNILTSK